MLRFPSYEIKRRMNLSNPDVWNERFRDIDLRIAATEQYGTAVDTAIDELISFALQTLSNTFTPLILDAQSRLNTLGVSFFALSSTSLTLPLATSLGK